MDLFTAELNILPRVRIIGHVSYKEPWTHFPRTINEYIFFFVKSGELYIQEDGIKFSLKKNDYLLLEPNKRHVGFKAASCHYFYIHFKHSEIIKKQVSKEEITQELIQNRKISLSSECFSAPVDGSSVCWFPKCYTLKNSTEIFEILNFANDDFYSRNEYYKNLASLKLSELIIKLSRDFTSTLITASQPHYSKTYIKVANIANYINNNYAKKITSKDIENLFESNYDYLNRIFEKIIGKSIFHYINETRISKSKELILTTQLNFSEIAYLVGIDDQYYFSRLFKKITGITPTEYYSENYNH
jgi:YesN/AraC family two-component response regulator